MACEIVVTGASGFVGQALMQRLLKDGFSVTGLSRQKISGVTTVVNYADVLVPDGAILVHLAQGANTSDAFGNEDIELCRTLSSMPWRHIVYASSAIVYGDSKNYLRSPEEPVLAFSDYSNVKIACEEIVSKVGGTCIRLGNLYGPGMNYDTVVSAILRQIPGDGPLKLQSTLPVRDFLWIEDAASCIVSACQKMPGGIFNAGSGSGTAVGDVARLALTIAGESMRPVVGVTSSGKSSYLALDITKTQSVLDWTPEIDISAGLYSLLRLDKNDE